MATPSGDPTVSLLPQPSNPVPIEPMRGGGTENVSLLPQPTIPVPIEAMKGGALQGTIQKFIFSPKSSKLQPYIEKAFKYKENVDKYIKTRQTLWGDDKSDYDFFETVDTQVIPKLTNLKNKGKVEQIAKISPGENTYMFVVTKPEQLTKILYFINQDIAVQSKNDIYNNYILIDGTDNRKVNNFSLVFKNIIEFIYQNGVDKPEEERQNIFFLYDKLGKSLFLTGRELSGSRARKAAFEYLINLEPTFVQIPFKRGTDDYSILFTALNKKPDGFGENTIVITTSQAQEKKLDVGKEKKLLSDLEKDTIYAISPADYESQYLYISFEDSENADILPPPPPVVVPPPAAVPPPPAAVVPTPPPAADVVPPLDTIVVPLPSDPIAPLRKSPPVEYVLSGKDEVKINLGGASFTVRTANEETLKEWRENIFSESEQKLFEEIGIDSHFLTENQSARKKEFLEKRGDFLKSLVLSNCFLDTQFLLRRECETSRDFLAELYELKHVDRIKAITTAFGDVFDITLRIQAPKGATIVSSLEILPDLDSILAGLEAKPRRKGLVDLSSLFNSISIAAAVMPIFDILNLDRILAGIQPVKRKEKGPINISNVISPEIVAVVAGPLSVQNLLQINELASLPKTRSKGSTLNVDVSLVDSLPSATEQGKSSASSSPRPSIFTIFGRPSK
jgi:hypothetical protein